MGTPSLTLNDVIPPLPPSPPPSWSIFSGGKWDSVVWSAIFNILRVYFIYIKIWSVSACMWCLYHFTIKGPNTDNFLCSLSRKMPSFHPKLINFWLSQLEVFIGPRSDHSLPMSVTHWLTNSLTTLLKTLWIDLCWWNQISERCWHWNEIEV